MRQPRLELWKDAIIVGQDDFLADLQLFPEDRFGLESLDCLNWVSLLIAIRMS